MNSSSQDTFQGLLHALPITHLYITIEAIDTLHLPPYKGSTLRGGLGNALKQLLCVFENTQCKTCLLKEQCLYALAFEGIGVEDHPFLRKMPRAPQPFVIRPGLEAKQVYHSGETFEFELLLFGKIIDYLGFFIQGLAHFGNRGIGKGRGRFFIRKIVSRSPGPKKRLIFNPLVSDTFQEPLTFNLDDILNTSEISQDSECFLNFLTPLRIVEKGEYVIPATFSFQILWRSLLRRAVNLSALYAEQNCAGLDYSSLGHLADNIQVKEYDQLYWYDWNRYSNRQNKKMKLGGLKGEVLIKGELEPCLSLMALGRYIHAGKNTSFGLGQYSFQA